MIVLMVAEKPSLAQSIAHILSNGRMNTRQGKSGESGFFYNLNLYNSKFCATLAFMLYSWLVLDEN